MGRLWPKHIAYLKSRNFSPRKIQLLWKIQGIGIGGQHAWHIYIPIIHKGKTVSWTTRRCANIDPRYQSAKPEQEILHHKDLLYGEDYCSQGIIIHEGPTDVWRTGPGAVATLGTSFTIPQVARMVKYPKRVICFDSSAAAQRRARQLFDLLLPYPGETLNVRLESGDDPAEASREELKGLRDLIR